MFLADLGTLRTQDILNKGLHQRRRCRVGAHPGNIFLCLGEEFLDDIQGAKQGRLLPEFQDPPVAEGQVVLGG